MYSAAVMPSFLDSLTQDERDLARQFHEAITDGLSHDRITSIQNETITKTNRLFALVRALDKVAEGSVPNHENSQWSRLDRIAKVHHNKSANVSSGATTRQKQRANQARQMKSISMVAGHRGTSDVIGLDGLDLGVNPIHPIAWHGRKVRPLLFGVVPMECRGITACWIDWIYWIEIWGNIQSNSINHCVKHYEWSEKTLGRDGLGYMFACAKAYSRFDIDFLPQANLLRFLKRCAAVFNLNSSKEEDFAPYGGVFQLKDLKSLLDLERGNHVQMYGREVTLETASQTEHEIKQWTCNQSGVVIVNGALVDLKDARPKHWNNYLLEFDERGLLVRRKYMDEVQISSKDVIMLNTP